jgi:hypothetical protein
VKKRIRLIAVFVALGGCLGCSKSGLPIVPVSGKVTFEGGPPPANGTISFVPITVAEGMPRRPGTAAFGTDGNFSVTSFKKDDGLIPGSYSARVECWKGNPATSSDPNAFEKLSLVPKDFAPPPVVVEAKSGKVEVVIDVPLKK